MDVLGRTPTAHGAVGSILEPLIIVGDFGAVIFVGLGSFRSPDSRARVATGDDEASNHQGRSADVEQAEKFHRARKNIVRLRPTRQMIPTGVSGAGSVTDNPRNVISSRADPKSSAGSVPHPRGTLERCERRFFRDVRGGNGRTGRPKFEPAGRYSPPCIPCPESNELGPASPSTECGAAFGAW